MRVFCSHLFPFVDFDAPARLRRRLGEEILTVRGHDLEALGQERSAGFLQGVMVAPVSRLSLVLGKLAGGTAIALLQALLFLLFAPLAGISLTPFAVARLALLFALVGIGFTGLGFIFALSVTALWTLLTVTGAVLVAGRRERA
jgi:ABC-type multidrug transport system permease subunit